MKKVTVFLLFAVMSTLGLEAGEPVDLQVVSRIRAEGLNNSKVMETLHQLTDVHGSRLTGSPGLASASAWCRDQLAEWGLVNSKLESWGEFGQGWSLEGFSLNMTAPYYSPLIGYPKAWTPGTQGRIEATPMPIEASNPEELKKYGGKLKGALVMFPNNREAETHFEADAQRRSDEDLEKLVLAPEPGRRPGFQARRAQFRQRRQMRQKMVEFLKAEGAVATLEASRGEHGTLFVGSGGSRDPEKEMPLPGIVLAIEHYNRIKRLLKSEVPVKIELEFQARYHQEDLNGYNVVAEIPGTDPNLADEVVMLGAHIDSWHAGTGATDNAAGVAVTMEAARIIQALDLKPRRTIRIGLWSGNVVRPAFPDVSFKEEVMGVVVAWIETDEQGDVVSVTILQSPHKEIGSAVKKALARWRFAPTTLKGKLVRVAGKLTFYYEIENGVGLVLSPEEKRALRARRPVIVKLDDTVYRRHHNGS